MEFITEQLSNNKQINKYPNDSLSSVAPFRVLNIGNTKKIFIRFYKTSKSIG